MGLGLAYHFQNETTHNNRMALCTSTPKCKLLEETVSLLSLDSGEEDFSSGYDSPVYTSDRNLKRSCQRHLQLHESSDDSDFSSEESTLFDDCASSEEEDDDDIESPGSMKVTSTQTLVDNIRYILSMPDLCDLMFIVGPQRIPVYGIKAILSTRSRSFFAIFLKHSKEALKDKKKTKKTKNNFPEQNNKLNIIIDNYDADVFRTFLLFVHCGSVVMDATNVTGLLCLASEFDIPDLRNACWEFIERCMNVPSNASILMKDTFQYGDHRAAQKLRLKILRIPVRNQSTSISSKESTPKASTMKYEQDACTSTETIV